MKLSSFAPALVLGAFGLGCDKIPVEMHTQTVVQHADGTVEKKESHWKGTLDQLPAQLGKAGKELGDVTAKMAKELTDVPPPGKVELKDLAPELAKYQGQKNADFLVEAKDEAGKPITFQYVKLGEPSYDEFFKTAQEIYALVYQTTQVISQMKQASSKILNKPVEGGENLKKSVEAALGTATATHDEAAPQLQSMAEMAQTLGVLIPQIANKIGKLISTGEALVASAATSLTNPKVVTHLGLVKEGLVSSIKVIKESGSLMVGMGKDLSGFGKS
jgi:hypothetical protein